MKKRGAGRGDGDGMDLKDWLRDGAGGGGNKAPCNL